MIFITGFHHSGTSFLAEIVEKLGVNFGGPLDRHHEHEELKKLDDQLIGDWTNPRVTEVGLFMETPVPAGLEAYKNPRLMVTWGAWDRNFPKAKWLWIERDIHDVAMSIMADKERLQDPGFWLRLQAHYGAVWMGGAAFRTNSMGITYRELCEYPEFTTKRIGLFLGIGDEKIEEVAKWVAENAKFKTYARPI